ncbi:hypothetical protein MBLNU459_g8067t1 [Dothideomycetes sp. NU459]
MLGRLNMTIKECIKVYKDFGEAIFSNKRPFWKLKFNRYDHKRLETFMRNVAGGNSHEDPPFQNPKDPGRLNDKEQRHQSRFSQTRVGVLTITKGTNDQLFLLRSYPNRTRVTNNVQDRGKLLNLQHQQDCATWEAARATSAAPTFFRPIKINGLIYIDGGLQANNPSYQAWLEVNAMHQKNPERCQSTRGGIQCFVSIGTGKGAPHDLIVDGNWIRRLVSIVGDALAKMTDPEPIHAHTESHCADGTYFRFNVEKGLEKMKLDEYKVQNHEPLTVQRITTAVSTYLNQDQDARNNLRVLATNLVEQRRTRHDILASRSGNGLANGHGSGVSRVRSSEHAEAPASPVTLRRRPTVPEMEAQHVESELAS